MKLRGIDFGHVFNASGARGFAGEAYWFHRLLRPFGLRYEGATFVSKTTTFAPRRGNMELDEQQQPRKLFPDCIVVKPAEGVVLNAVGLSGPGLPYLAEAVWPKTIAGFDRAVISIMSLETDPAKQRWDYLRMVERLFTLARDLGKEHLALQVNLSCPNAGVEQHEVTQDLGGALDILDDLGLPILAKVSATMPVGAAAQIARHRAVDAIVVSNTVKWGELPDRIDWHGIFGTDISPLARYGGGGLSGAPLLPLVEDWIQRARRPGIANIGIDKPIVGGGGVLSEEDADRLIDAGASAIELGSVSILRPWRVQGIVRHVNAKLASREASS